MNNKKSPRVEKYRAQSDGGMSERERKHERKTHQNAPGHKRLKRIHSACIYVIAFSVK